MQVSLGLIILSFAGSANRAFHVSRGGAVVVGVLVTYEPDLAKLDVLLRALRRQLASVVVIDNGSSLDIENGITADLRPDSWCQVVRLHSNCGIAAAQNVGIDLARKAGANFVMLFDQDSEPAPNMIQKLLDAASAQSSLGVAVAAVGPRYTDERQDNPPPFLRIRGISVERQTCEHNHSVVEVDYLIASGSLIPMSTLDAVGPMREDLFIDYVDIEWGLRARRAGFQSFGVCGATMRHDLGSEPINLFGRMIPLHSPLRHYYHFRNAVCLYCERGLPLNWKIADGWRLLLKYGAYTLLAKPRHKHWWMMSLGIVHGLMGRMGKFGKS
ncbi:MAG: glycosyltransferase family 2 protein [Thiobacillus sp.]